MGQWNNYQPRKRHTQSSSVPTNTITKLIMFLFGLVQCINKLLTQRAVSNKNTGNLTGMCLSLCVCAASGSGI